MDDDGYKEGENQLQEMFRVSAATSLPSEVQLTPIVLRERPAELPYSPSARAGGSPQTEPSAKEILEVASSLDVT